MKQILVGHAATLGTPRFTPIMQLNMTPSLTESETQTPWPTAGVLRNLILELSAAPGAGNSRTITLRVNGVNTGLTVTIAHPATSGRITGVNVSVAVGDRVSFSHTASGTPTAADGRWTLEFEGTTAKESGYSLSYCGPAVSQSASPRYMGLFATNQAMATAVLDIPNIVAAAGTLTRLTATADSAPGAGAGLTFYVFKNGVKQDGTAGSVNTAAAVVGAVTSATATFSLALSPGDVVYVQSVATGTFTGKFWSLGCTFVATTDGDWQVCGGTTAAVGVSNAIANYVFTTGITGLIATSETNFVARVSGAVTGFTLSNFRVLLGTAPGGATSRLFDLRKNATSAGPTLTFTGAATTNSDLTNTMSIADGDLWGLRSVPTSTPANTKAQWAAVGSAGAAPVATVPHALLNTGLNEGIRGD